jgi:hypothetical protein
VAASPGILAGALNAAFGLRLADLAEAREWLDSGGWEELDMWLASRRSDPRVRPPRPATGQLANRVPQRGDQDTRENT